MSKLGTVHSTKEQNNLVDLMNNPPLARFNVLRGWGGGLGLEQKHGGCHIETPVDIVLGIGVGGGAGVELVELVDFDIGREGLCWSSK